MPASHQRVGGSIAQEPRGGTRRQHCQEWQSITGCHRQWGVCTALSHTRRRFQTTFLGSRAVTGQLVPLGMLDAEDKNGETLADVLYKHGFQGSEEALERTAYPPNAIRGSVIHPSIFMSILRCGRSNSLFIVLHSQFFLVPVVNKTLLLSVPILFTSDHI